MPTFTGLFKENIHGKGAVFGRLISNDIFRISLLFQYFMFCN